MKSPRDFRHHQRSTVFVALLLFQLIIILIQLWLFVSVLEDLLIGKYAMAIPAAVASVLCLAVNWWMLAGIYRMEHTD